MKTQANPFSLSMIMKKQADLGMDKLSDLADSSVEAINKQTRYGIEKISAVINLPSSSKWIKINTTQLPHLFPTHD